MKTSILICIRSLCLFSLLICLPAFVHAQERLQIADLFSKYGEQKDVTRVELNGSILKSYRMTTYKSLVFKNVSPYRREIQQAIVHDKQDNAKKAQEVMESGVLRSAYYQLKEVERNGKKLNRYIIFKIGKDSMGTLIYIEGLLSEKEMMDMALQIGITLKTIYDMKTRIMILACLLAVPAGRMAAQQQTDPEQKATVQTQGDSIIIRKGKGDMRIKVYEEQLEDGEKKEVQIYEESISKVDADKRAFLRRPAIHPKKRRYNAYEPHCSGLYIGYSRLANDFLSFGASDKMGLDLSKSWEFGFNILSVYHNFKKNPHWGINLQESAGGYRSFNIDGNYALLKENGTSIFTAGNEDTSYNKSRLRHFFFRVPVLMEWQQRVGRNKVFFNAVPNLRYVTA